MSISTDTYWDVDGTPLQTMAFNIATLGETRLSPPPFRGDNAVVPFSPGAYWLPKVVESKTITLAMWVIGSTEDGDFPSSSSAQRLFEDNWQKIRRLFWTPRRQLTLTKRFYVNGTLITAVGKAQFAGGLEPVMSGPVRGAFTVDLFMADPFFYGAEVSQSLALNTDETFTVDGDEQTTAVNIDFHNAFTNPKVTNSTTSTWAQYTGGIASGDTVTLDVANFSAEYDPSSGSNYAVSGKVDHDGLDPFWLALETGSNTLRLTTSSGNGSATVRYQPRWF